jgi:hypothetical protein
VWQAPVGWFDIGPSGEKRHRHCTLNFCEGKKRIMNVGYANKFQTTYIDKKQGEKK